MKYYIAQKDDDGKFKLLNSEMDEKPALRAFKDAAQRYGTENVFLLRRVEVFVETVVKLSEEG